MKTIAKAGIPRGLKYLLIALPFMIFTFMFSYVPLFGWFISFTDYTIGSKISSLNFTGFKAFTGIWMQKEELFRVITNSLAMSGLGLLTSPLAVIFAILLNEIKAKKLRQFIQTTTTFPNFISWIIVYGFAFAIFSNNGLFNNLLGALGLEQSATGLLGDTKSVWFFQLFLQIWKGLGWGSIIYLAAISGIDQEFYEAAEIDGANKFDCIRFITIPNLLPTYFVLLILAISNILNNGFDQYFVFYNPMVATKIEVLDYFIYKLAFILNDMPMSIAVGMIKSLISIALVFSANQASKKIRGVAIF